MKVLLTGGAGYIGSHTIVEMYAAGHDVVVVDNFANASPNVMERVEAITGKKNIPVYAEDSTEAGTEYRAIDLENTDLSVLEIGLSVGCEDQNYFSRLFKEQTGVAPTAYRLRYRGCRI